MERRAVAAPRIKIIMTRLFKFLSTCAGRALFESLLYGTPGLTHSLRLGTHTLHTHIGREQTPPSMPDVLNKINVPTERLVFSHTFALCHPFFFCAAPRECVCEFFARFVSALCTRMQNPRRPFVLPPPFSVCAQREKFARIIHERGPSRRERRSKRASRLL